MSEREATPNFEQQHRWCGRLLQETSICPVEAVFLLDRRITLSRDSLTQLYHSGTGEPWLAPMAQEVVLYL